VGDLSHNLRSCSASFDGTKASDRAGARAWPACATSESNTKARQSMQPPNSNLLYLSTPQPREQTCVILLHYIIVSSAFGGDFRGRRRLLTSLHLSSDEEVPLVGHGGGGVGEKRKRIGCESQEETRSRKSVLVLNINLKELISNANALPGLDSGQYGDGQGFGGEEGGAVHDDCQEPRPNTI